jgi:hypothetical protein
MLRSVRHLPALLAFSNSLWKRISRKYVSTILHKSCPHRVRRWPFSARASLADHNQLAVLEKDAFRRIRRKLRFFLLSACQFRPLVSDRNASETEHQITCADPEVEGYAANTLAMFCTLKNTHSKDRPSSRIVPDQLVRCACNAGISYPPGRG